jgi:hypothetical protein
VCVDPAASYYGHINAGALHDLANSTVTVVAGAVAVAAATGARAATTSAHASSMVDPGAKPVAGTFEARMGTPEVGPSFVPGAGWRRAWWWSGRCWWAGRKFKKHIRGSIVIVGAQWPAATMKSMQ